MQTYNVTIQTREGEIGDTHYEASTFGAVIRSVILGRLFKRGGSIGEKITIRIERLA